MTAFNREVNFLKNIYLFIIFISLVLYVFFSMISISLKTYKDVNKDIKKLKSEFILQNNDYDELWKKYSEKTKDNTHTLESIIKIYSEIEISKLLEKYFTTFELSQKNSSQKKDYKVLEIQVKAVTTNPKNFYLFVENLSKINNLVEISYPLQFESNNRYLDVEFILKVYTFE